MSFKFITVERDGPVTTITLNRPEVMNAVHTPMHFEMDEAVNAFAADPDQWVGIVTGAGERAFSAGNDLKWQAAGGEMRSPATGFGGLALRFDLAKPLIAAVNGVAMGGGFEIALACDIIVASEKAVFALPEPRVGLAALAGGLHRLPRAIGIKRAMGMILTARRVSAQQGLDLGFVHEVTEPDGLMAAARRLAAQIGECSPMSIRASKEAVMRGLDEPSLDAAIRNQRTYPAVAALFKSDDFVEGPRAFAEKRMPNWAGR
ncbi:MAG: enoyl-CoA hydratase-related protein [Caulobacteraceae bacterium]